MAKRKRSRTPKVVAVHWIDAVGSGDETTRPYHVVTFGMVIGDEDDYIRVASEIIEEGSVRDVTAIPKGMVQSITAKTMKLPEELSGWQVKGSE